jgi:hypothetical protein
MSAKSIADSTVAVSLESNGYRENWNKRTPVVTVSDSYRGINLVEDSDFTVEYANNTNAGTATATVYGSGNYEGSIAKKFTIYSNDVDYDVDIDGNTSNYDWRIFYEDNEHIYLIASYYVPNTHSAIPKSLSLITYSTYGIHWSDTYAPSGNGAADIFTNGSTMTKYLANKYLSVWKATTTTSTTAAAKATAQLMNTEAWSGFANSTKVKNLTSNPEELVAIGGPTLEMWIASWNEKYGTYSNEDTKLQLYCNNIGGDGPGYLLGKESSPTDETYYMRKYMGDG